MKTNLYSSCLILSSLFACIGLVTVLFFLTNAHRALNADVDIPIHISDDFIKDNTPGNQEQRAAERDWEQEQRDAKNEDRDPVDVRDIKTMS